MGKKKKSKKKRLNKQRKKILNMDSNQIFDKAMLKYNAKKFKEAINFFKIALTKASTEKLKIIESRLFESYLEREKELRQKGLIVEADSVRNTAMNYMPEFSDITESQILLFFEHCDLPLIFEVYGKYLAYHHTRSSDIETIIADKLVIHDCWNLLKQLPDPSIFEKHSVLIKQAVSLMNKAKWEDAMIVLKDLPRSSPFAHLKMLCRAMTSFYADNETDLIKAGSMVPDISMFKKITDTLQLSPNDKIEGDLSVKKQVKEENKLLKFLWNGDFRIRHEIEFILDQVKKGRNNAKLRKTIAEAAKTIFPDSPETAMIFILETLCVPDLHGQYDNNTRIYAMAKKLVKGKADIINAKADFMFSKNLLKNAGTYFTLLKKEFPDSEERKIAESMVILYTLELIDNMRDYTLLSDINMRTKKLFGITTNDYNITLLEMALHGAKTDPENKQLFIFATKIACTNTRAKELKEKLMFLMSESFPEDPLPYLELAMLYHRKNAFRKAETVLQKAIALAPNDHRVVDKQIITLLLSADRNAGRNKFHLVWKDVEKAEKFNSRKNALLIKAKKIFYRIYENPGISVKNIKKMFDGFSAFETLKVLSIIFFSLNGRNVKYDSKLEKKMLSVLKKEIANMKKLSPPEICALLLPFQGDWQLLFPTTDPALFFLKPSLNINGKSSGYFKPVNNIFDAFSNSELINLMERIIQPDLFDYFITELEKRSRKTDKEKNPFIEFYLLILKQLSLRGSDEDFDILKKLIEKVDEDTKEKLRATARKLSKYASGRLKMALEDFDFDIMDSHSVDPFFNPFIVDYDDDDEYYDDEFDEEFDEIFGEMANFPDIDDLPANFLKMLPKNAIIEEIEDSIDQADLRGATDFELKNAKKEFNAMPGVKFIKSLMQKLLNKKDKQKLSKEAKFIYL